MTTRDLILAEYHDVLEEIAAFSVQGCEVPQPLLTNYRSLKARLNNQEN